MLAMPHKELHADFNALQAHGVNCPKCNGKNIVSLLYAVLHKNHSDLAR